ncbi:hypothetical protein IKO_05913 [Bacillus cereus VDM034]|nr:hypothetical protein IKO_05913 [Bacillus cereus VDM034]
MIREAEPKDSNIIKNLYKKLAPHRYQIKKLVVTQNDKNELNDHK